MLENQLVLLQLRYRDLQVLRCFPLLLVIITSLPSLRQWCPSSGLTSAEHPPKQHPSATSCRTRATLEARWLCCHRRPCPCTLQSSSSWLAPQTPPWPCQSRRLRSRQWLCHHCHPSVQRFQ